MSIKEFFINFWNNAFPKHGKEDGPAPQSLRLGKYKIISSGYGLLIKDQDDGGYISKDNLQLYAEENILNECFLTYDELAAIIPRRLALEGMTREQIQDALNKIRKMDEKNN